MFLTQWQLQFLTITWQANLHYQPRNCHFNLLDRWLLIILLGHFFGRWTVIPRRFPSWTILLESSFPSQSNSWSDCISKTTAFWFASDLSCFFKRTLIILVKFSFVNCVLDRPTNRSLLGDNSSISLMIDGIISEVIAVPWKKQANVMQGITGCQTNAKQRWTHLHFNLFDWMCAAYDINQCWKVKRVGPNFIWEHNSNVGFLWNSDFFDVFLQPAQPCYFTFYAII